MTKEPNTCCFCGKRSPSTFNVCAQCLIERQRCPECGGTMETRGAKGYDRHGQELEAEWEECTKCGYTS